jgi:hypothetical protein
MTPNTDLTRFVIETPDFVRSMTRARHLMREAELALKPFGSKAPNPKQARKMLRGAIKELRRAAVQ